METYIVVVHYNSRLDVDNVTAITKLVLDYLRRSNYLLDDNPKHFKSLFIQFDKELKKNTYKLKILPAH